MLFLSLLPAILSALLLAAHFLRGGHLVLMIICLALPLLFLVRRSWVPVVVQLALLAGALEWIRTLMLFAAERRALGEPATRLALILGGVAAFTVVAGLLMRVPVVRRHYARPVTRMPEAGMGDQGRSVTVRANPRLTSTLERKRG